MGSAVQHSRTKDGPAPVSYDTEQYRPGRAITDREPENELSWKSIGKRVAARNLWIAVPALLVAFVVWQVWSVTATNLKDVGFSFSTSRTRPSSGCRYC